MSASAKGFVVTAVLLIAIASGCKSSGDKGGVPANNANAKTSSAKPDDQGIIHSGAGEEKEKPTAGKSPSIPADRSLVTSDNASRNPAPGEYDSARDSIRNCDRDMFWGNSDICAPS